MSDDVAVRPTSGRRWLVAAFLVTVVLAALLLLLPGYSTVTASSNAGVTVERRSLLEVEGLWVAFYLLIPVVLSAVPLMVEPRIRRRTAWVATAALAAIAVLGLATVGLFLIPSVILMAIGTSRCPQDVR